MCSSFIQNIIITRAAEADDVTYISISFEFLLILYDCKTKVRISVCIIISICAGEFYNENNETEQTMALYFAFFIKVKVYFREVSSGV